METIWRGLLALPKREPISGTFSGREKSRLIFRGMERREGQSEKRGSLSLPGLSRRSLARSTLSTEMVVGKAVDVRRKEEDRFPFG